MEHESSRVEDRSFLGFSDDGIQQMQMVLLQLWPRDQNSKDRKIYQLENLLPDCRGEYPWNNHAYTLEEDQNQSNAKDPMYPILSKSRIYNHHKLHKEEHDDCWKTNISKPVSTGFSSNSSVILSRNVHHFGALPRVYKAILSKRIFSLSVNLQEYSRQILSVNHWLNISDHYQEYWAYHSLAYQVQSTSNFSPKEYIA